MGERRAERHGGARRCGPSRGGGPSPATSAPPSAPAAAPSAVPRTTSAGPDPGHLLRSLVTGLAIVAGLLIACLIGVTALTRRRRRARAGFARTRPRHRARRRPPRADARFGRHAGAAGLRRLAGCPGASAAVRRRAAVAARAPAGEGGALGAAYARALPAARALPPSRPAPCPRPASSPRPGRRHRPSHRPPTRRSPPGNSRRTSTPRLRASRRHPVAG